MKRKISIVFGLIAAFAIISAGTHAFFSTDSKARNVITTGEIKFELHEVTKDGSLFPVNGVEVLPGDTVSKIVTVENTGEHSEYLRVMLTKGINDDQLTADDKMSMNINEDYWKFGKDGYCYYIEPLSPGKSTEPIFTEVHIDGPSVGNEYIGKTFTLNIAVDAVQSENNGENVWDAVGWPKTAE